MKSIAKISFLCFELLLVGTHAASIIPAWNREDAIPNSYIVVMEEGISLDSFDSHRQWVSNIEGNSLVDGGLEHTFDIPGFQAYSGKFDKNTIEKIAASPSVKYVEQDTVVNAQGLVVQKNATWYLARISHTKLPKVYEYIYDDSDDTLATVYVVDSGVDDTNPGLAGRVIPGINTTPEGDADLNGHGTAVAEVIAGTVHGVAKLASIISVKVLNSAGSGSTANTIRGLTWALQDAKETDNVQNSIINLSFGGGFNSALNQAVESLINSGMFVAASVGGENRDAANESPVSARGVCAVAASNITDQPLASASYGSIVDFYAPGENIPTRINGNEPVTMSGSSFAVAQVSGMVARLISTVGGRNACENLKKLGLSVIQSPRPNTTRLLLHDGSKRP
ncbi:Suppressor of the cold-sensitive snRNP biogenesis mutant brr1-1 [Myotisia sp. PD_48]|nr:Suppressor of the cold-sensitive snRNP biogenesis mutant brr1-1 [Myotisia sp. PD_48]